MEDDEQQQQQQPVVLPPVVVPVGPVPLTILMALQVCRFNEVESASLVAQAFPDWSVFLRMSKKISYPFWRIMVSVL